MPPLASVCLGFAFWGLKKIDSGRCSEIIENPRFGPVFRFRLASLREVGKSQDNPNRSGIQSPKRPLAPRKLPFENTAHAPVRPALLRRPLRIMACVCQEATGALVICFRRFSCNEGPFSALAISAISAINLLRVRKRPNHGLVVTDSCFAWCTVSEFRFRFRMSWVSDRN